MYNIVVDSHMLYKVCPPLYFQCTQVFYIGDSGIMNSVTNDDGALWNGKKNIDEVLQQIKYSFPLVYMEDTFCKSQSTLKEFI